MKSKVLSFLTGKAHSIIKERAKQKKKIKGSNVSKEEFDRGNIEFLDNTELLKLKNSKQYKDLSAKNKKLVNSLLNEK